MTVVGALAAGLAMALTVLGEGTCPSPEMVAARLQRFGGLKPNHYAKLVNQDTSLLVELYVEPDKLIGTRTIEAAGACTDLAEVAAVIIASLQSEAELKGSDIVLPPIPIPTPPPPPPPPSPSTPPSPPPAHARTPLVFDVGAGFVGSFSVPNGSAFAPGGLIEASLGRGRWLGRVALSGELERRFPLGTGQVAWWRLTTAVGPELRLVWRVLMVDCHVDLLLAAVHVRGIGFSPTFGRYQFDPGVGGGVRLAARYRMFAPFLGISVSGWWLRQRTTADGPPPVAEVVPRFEVLLSTGAWIGRFR